MSTVRAECRVMLRRCLAIVVRKEGCQGDPGDFWMYESGYLLFQGLLSANSVCWWNSALNGATKSINYRGYISPGAILVDAEPCALEVLRGAWARRVLQPPAGYQIVSLDDIEDCSVSTVTQTQWTPLPEAVCAVILRLSSQGRPAGTETIREALIMTFPHVSPPSEKMLYDTLVQLTTERKLYHTSRGYFIVTPERRRSRSHSRGRRRHDDGCGATTAGGKGMLMSTEEALVLVHGEMATIRDGEVTHQCIQTNLADVICGGNPSDKVLYPRSYKRRSASFPAPKSPDRRGSFKLWGSNRRLRRSASTRTLARNYTDSSSSTEYPTSSESMPTPKKGSLLSRLFRRSKRSQCQISTFSAQFPPSEWFNSKAIHLHNVGTQTATADEMSELSFCIETASSSKSATLPRRHRRQLSNDSTYVTSREQSPSLMRCRSSSHASSTLPRNPNNNGNGIRSPLHATKSRDSSRKTSRSSLSAGKMTTSTPSSSEKKDDPSKSTIGSISDDSSRTSHDLANGTTKCADETDRSAENAAKSSMNIDNSGPSSIESHKSGKTGSSLTSGPSSLESHKTVIARTSPPSAASCLPGDAHNKAKRSPKRRDSLKRAKPLTAGPSVNLTSNGAANGAVGGNSFTLQVTTNQSGSGYAGGNATINSGTGTKIYVQNSPVRSVITFENGQANDPNPNLVIINGTAAQQTEKPQQQQQQQQQQQIAKNTNNQQTHHDALNNSRDTINNECSLNKEAMNNIRKLSLQMPQRDSLNYRNLIKNVPFNSNSTPDSPITNGYRDFLAKNSFDGSNPPSPTKPYDATSFGGSTGNVYIINNNKNNLTDSITSLDKSLNHGNRNKLVEKNILGSEPNISCKDPERKDQYPSLTDLSFNFTSLAAQKILKGVSINSIDTLVELNMAASGEKQNNCDVVHTDFGLV